MGDEPTRSRLEAVAGSVKWITPWGDCTVVIDSDGALTLTTSIVPAPVFTSTEWQSFCSAVNEQIINNKKDES